MLNVQHASKFWFIYELLAACTSALPLYTGNTFIRCLHFSWCRDRKAIAIPRLYLEVLPESGEQLQMSGYNDSCTCDHLSYKLNFTRCCIFHCIIKHNIFLEPMYVIVIKQKARKTIKETFPINQSRKLSIFHRVTLAKASHQAFSFCNDTMR